MKRKFILDAVHLSDVTAELEGTPAAQFAYPATLYAVSQYRARGGRDVRQLAVQIAQDMARAEI
jgi:hypothetical protein